MSAGARPDVEDTSAGALRDVGIVFEHDRPTREVDLSVKGLEKTVLPLDEVRSSVGTVVEVIQQRKAEGVADSRFSRDESVGHTPQ